MVLVDDYEPDDGTRNTPQQNLPLRRGQGVQPLSVWQYPGRAAIVHSRKTPATDMVAESRSAKPLSKRSDSASVPVLGRVRGWYSGPEGGRGSGESCLTKLQ